MPRTPTATRATTAFSVGTIRLLVNLPVATPTWARHQPWQAQAVRSVVCAMEKALTGLSSDSAKVLPVKNLMPAPPLRTLRRTPHRSRVACAASAIAIRLLVNLLEFAPTHLERTPAATNLCLTSAMIAHHPIPISTNRTSTTPKSQSPRKPVVPISSRSVSEHSTSARAAAPSANWPGKKFEVLSPISTIILLLPKKEALRSVTLAMRQLMGRRLQVVPTPSLTIGPQRFNFRADLSSQRTNNLIKEFEITQCINFSKVTDNDCKTFQTKFLCQ